MRIFEVSVKVIEVGNKLAEPKKSNSSSEVGLEKAVVMLAGIDPKNDPQKIDDNH